MHEYSIRALGWAIEVTGHTLTKPELTFLKKWCGDNDYEFDNIPGSCEGILDGYNCYSSNSWQLGCVPLLDLNRFFLFEPKSKVSLPLTQALITNSKLQLKYVKDFDSVYKLKARYNKLLVYTEESKGTTAAWKLLSPSLPKVEDFTILYSKFVLGKETVSFVSGLEYCGLDLERDYDLEDLQGKVAYSKIL